MESGKFRETLFVLEMCAPATIYCFVSRKVPSLEINNCIFLCLRTAPPPNLGDCIAGSFSYLFTSVIVQSVLYKRGAYGCFASMSDAILTVALFLLSFVNFARKPYETFERKLAILIFVVEPIPKPDHEKWCGVIPLGPKISKSKYWIPICIWKVKLNWNRKYIFWNSLASWNNCTSIFGNLNFSENFNQSQPIQIPPKIKNPPSLFYYPSFRMVQKFSPLWLLWTI
jgi:hypothetical protein